jgi:uncharacterized protein (TIRG00374 family)
MRNARIGIGLSLAALLMVLLVRNVDLAEAARTATLVPLQVLAASTALVLVGYSVRAWRWQLMLEGAGVEVGYGKAASIFFAAFALNNVLPLRAGDIYRCVAASRLQDGTIAKSLATLLAERLLDLAALTVFLSIVLLCFRGTSLVSLPIAVVLALGMLVLGLLIVFPTAARRLVNAVARRFEDFPIILKAAAWFDRFGVAIEATLAPSALSSVVALTAFAWILELSVFVLIGSALRGVLLLSGGLGAGVVGTLATLVPSMPGHIGTFDFFAAEGFRYGGLSLETAVAAAVLCHIVVVVPVTLCGGIRLAIDR